MGVTFAEHLAASKNNRLVVYYLADEPTKLSHITHTGSINSTKIAGYFNESVLYTKPIASETYRLTNCFRSAMGRAIDRTGNRDFYDLYRETTYKFDNQSLSAHLQSRLELKENADRYSTSHVQIGSKSIIDGKVKNLLPYTHYVEKDGDPTELWHKIAFFTL